jgi:D-alanine-D-alanine ligase
MNNKIKVAVLFGGKSAEHEVSLNSAKNVIRSLDGEKYDVVEIMIDKEGNWDKTLLDGVDVVFPVLHGPFGEDGSMQGFLKINNLPFVGPGVLGSAVAMDKDVTKRLLRDAGLPIGKFLVIYKTGVILNLFQDLIKQLGLPFFLKPANLGSSVGVNKVHNEEEFKKFVEEAFQYDTKIIAEEFIQGREIECSVLGNENPKSSVPGEVAASHEFYDYDAKYIDEAGADLKVPAELSGELAKEAQDLAIKTFRTLCLEGMARIDLFLTDDNKFYVNEANTIPGFTNISMYPKLWEASGIGHGELVDRLIELAMERFERENKLKSSI